MVLSDIEKAPIWLNIINKQDQFLHSNFILWFGQKTSYNKTSRFHGQMGYLITNKDTVMSRVLLRRVIIHKTKYSNRYLCFQYIYSWYIGFGFMCVDRVDRLQPIFTQLSWLCFLRSNFTTWLWTLFKHQLQDGIDRGTGLTYSQSYRIKTVEISVNSFKQTLKVIQ